MRCTSPKTVWENPEGGRPIFSLWSGVAPGREFLIGCGKCLGCQLDRSSSWATRAVHEARYFDRKCFLTLTWRDEDMPGNPGEARYEIRKFQVRFRKEFGSGHRFFGCMELGKQFCRPHGHLLVYGEDFKAGAFAVPGGSREHPLWSNPVLDRLWPFGFASVGELTQESASYVARYVVKKVGQPSTVRLVHPVTGEVAEWPTVYRPFYPLRPALGVRFLEEFSEDVWSGLRARGGARIPIPRAYSKRLKADDPERHDQLVQDRIQAMTAKRDLSEESPQRMAVKAEVMRAKLNFFTRERS